MHLLQTLATVIGYLVVIGGALAGFVKFCFWVYDQLQKHNQSSVQGYAIPNRTLSVATLEQREYWWHMGSMGQDPTMQIAACFAVTNIYSRPVRVITAEIRYGLFGRKRVVGDVSISQHFESNYYNSFPIPPEDTRRASLHLWLYPPVKKEQEDFIVHSVTLTDHFGNQHRTRSVRFQYQ